MKILLFTGAGASAELGIPTMRPMAERLRDHLEARELPSQILERFDENLEDSDYDIENLIEEMDSIRSGYKAQESWSTGTETPLATYASLLRSEAEWFVQHVCEGFPSDLAATLWHPTLRQHNNHDITLATTNYDRAIEIAAARHGIPTHDGFAPFENKEWAPWKGFSTIDGLKLLKVHGSTDWYHEKSTDTVWKLRHPMPLFGRINMTIHGEDRLSLKSAAVLPSREKIKSQPPYLELLTQFRNAAINADIAIFLGTSLRDPDFRSACVDAASSHPVYFVNRDGWEGVPRIPDDVRIIKESASRFLISTLPTALKTSNPKETLDKRAEGKPRPEGILSPLRRASDRKADPSDRCTSIETLLSTHTQLSKEEIIPLLHDASPDVQREALGPVLESPDRTPLLEIVKEIVADEPNPQLEGDVDLLLEKMIP